MSKLRGTKPQTKIYKLRGIDIELQPIAYGDLKETERNVNENKDDTSKQFEFVGNFLLKYTSLEEDDFGTEDWCITVEEATNLFFELANNARNPKATGLPMK